MNETVVEEMQRELCRKYGADFYVSEASHKIGIAENVLSNATPINGLRHPPENETTGWYIYAGTELSQSDEFFKPLHIHHIDDWFPQVKKYLGLPPGWRFLIADGYEDVWFDGSLLDV